MAKHIEQPNIAVDTNTGTPYSANKTGTVSAILSAKDKTKSDATIQAKNLEDTSKAMAKLNKNLEALFNNINSADLKNFSFGKDLLKAKKNFENAFADTKKIIDKGSTDIITLAKSVEVSNNAFDEMNMYYSVLNKQYDENTKSLKKLSAAQEKKLKNDEADLRYRKNIRSNQRQNIVNNAKEGNKDLNKAVQEMARNTQTVLTNLKTAISLDKLTNANTRSGAAQIQLDLMNSMNLSRSEFNSFKKQLYGQIDTSIYTAEEVRNSIGTIRDMGITNTTEAVNKMNTIIRGQQILGMSSEQQTKLQTLGNRTGRDSLTFQTNRMAKWMTMSTTLGQKQLSELVDLNTNLLTQFADLGIDTEEFEKTNTATTAALTALTGDNKYSNMYAESLASLASDEDNSSRLLGMSLPDFKSELSKGANLFDITDNGQGLLGDLYNNLMSNWDYTIGHLDNFTTKRGIDSNTAALIQKQAKYDLEHGRGAFTAYTNSYNVDDKGEALKTMEDNVSGATSNIAKLTNNFTNWISKSFDWIDLSNFETSMTIIIGLLSAIAASELLQTGASLIKGIFKGAKSFFNPKTNIVGKGVDKLVGTKLGGKLLGAGSKLGGTTGLSATSYGNGILGTASKLGGAGMIAGGAIWGGVDAFNAVKNADENFGKGHKFGAGVSGFFAGSTVHKNAEGKVDVGKNIGKGALSGAGKGALIGAGIGTFIGGPVGTAIGAGIGGLVGGIGGAISGWWKGKKAKEQEEREKEQLEATKEVVKNTSQANRILGDVRLNTSTRQISSVRAYTGEGSGPSYSPSALPKVTSTNGMGAPTGATSTNLPWRITSPFGNRTLSNGDKRHHNGVDFGIKIGTAIGAPVSGKVSSVQVDPRNTYPNGPSSAGSGIYIQGDDGTLYQFWHLDKVGVKAGERVTTGQTIGLSGNTGYSTGPHLHYGTKVKGAWVNPVPSYTTNGLFSADGKMITSVDGLSYSSTSTPEEAKSTVYSSRVRSFNSTNSTSGADGMGAVVEGLAEIKQTLLDLSERQTRDEKIMQMIQGTKKQDPRLA